MITLRIEEAVQLIIAAGELSCGGEGFVTKMPAIRIRDLADVMIQELVPAFGHPPQNIQIQIIGHKTGEKRYEELMNVEPLFEVPELAQRCAIRQELTGGKNRIKRDHIYRKVKWAIR